MSERNDYLVAESLNQPISSLLALGVILAGGASHRYGRDKALAELNGAPLLRWVIDRAKPQVDILAISGGLRAGFGLPTISDEVQGMGPLVALLSVLTWADERGLPVVATFSCDTPFMPSDLVGRLRAVLGDTDDCAVAYSGGKVHPTCALWKTAARVKVRTAFETGVRSLFGAIEYVNTSAVEFAFGEGGPEGDPFFNINCEADMAVAQAWLDAGHLPR